MSAIVLHAAPMQRRNPPPSTSLFQRAARSLAGALALLVCLLTGGPAFAQLVVDVTQGHQRPLPIAITDFGGPQGANIASVIRSDLDRSGLFAVQDPNAFLQRSPDLNVAPRFADWRVTETSALVVGRSTVSGGRLRVEFRLWDVYGEDQMLGLEFSSTEENWRRVAHKVADAIYERLTGAPGASSGWPSWTRMAPTRPTSPETTSRCSTRASAPAASRSSTRP
jgi:TolB protein